MVRQVVEHFSGVVAACFLLVATTLLSCQPAHQEQVDHWNDTAYGWHYRDLDSTEHYARKALEAADDYDDGRAEAYNNLAFVSIAKMNYALAKKQLDSVNVSDNQIELLIADILQMRLCQRESQNKDFYTYNERATRRMRRIGEKNEKLDARSTRRMIYAKSEYAITSSTYYYYVGLERASVSALSRVDEMDDIQQDTAQYLNYLYNVGAGGILVQGTQDMILQSEMDYLIRCYYLACQGNYVYWQANALQAISEHITNEKYGALLMNNNRAAITAFNTYDMPDSLIAGNFAQRALDLFIDYGDTYQTAGAYRTLAQCFEQIKDYQSALICLNDALKTKGIEQAPELVASIREQMSVIYSAINEKQKSDYNRNIYLDLQEQTRQDRFLESRAEQLSASVVQLNMMIAAVVALIIVAVVLLWYFNHKKEKEEKSDRLEHLTEPLERWEKENKQRMQALNDKQEEIAEETAIVEREIENNQLRNAEQRAKISLALSISPLIDRMIHEIERLKSDHSTPEECAERRKYIDEIIQQIDDTNVALTQWIQLRQGKISLHVESFGVKWLFDTLRRNTTSFRIKGITLRVDDTNDFVKADKALTLFMLNTLADNARKFTPAGGTVTVSSNATDTYVEISVCDTGCGMTEDQCASVFDHKSILNHDDADTVNVHSHGFGLKNCKGIIESYKKVSTLFNVCTIGVESERGKGSRFFFRLPKGIGRTLAAVIMLLGMFMPTQADEIYTPSDSALYIPPVPHKREIKLTAGQQRRLNAYLQKASAFSDSAYQCNLTARYSDCIVFSDSCRKYLNRGYLVIVPQGRELMEGMSGHAHEAAEISWLHQGLPINFATILEIRNETAVAALALHNMELYKYNNQIYTQLYKEKSADTSLGAYCYQMKKSENNKWVAVVILVIVLLALFPAYYILYFRHRLYFRFCIDRVKTINDTLASDSYDTDKLLFISRYDTSRFPQALRDIVESVKQALRTSIDNQLNGQEDIAYAEDRLRCAKFENGRLHVANNVLDNCLSTLKHETMYYPSHIRQLMRNGDNQLGTVEELMRYYRELYNLLLMQAMHQIDGHPFPCTPIDALALIPSSYTLGNTQPATVLGCKILLREVFNILYKYDGNGSPKVDITNSPDGYVTFNVHLNWTVTTPLFTATKENIPFLICRQIVRDNGTTTNRRACGILARSSDQGGTDVIVILAAHHHMNQTTF